MSLDPNTLEQFLDTLDRFVRERLIPNEHKVAEEDAIPMGLIQEIKDIGLFGLSIPEEYGGLGLTMSEEVAAAFILGQASPVFRSLIGTNNGIGSQGIIIDGSPEQKQMYLPRLATGEDDRVLRSHGAGRRIGCRIAEGIGASRW
jgi:acyl-CoA dehydrogenase